MLLVDLGTILLSIVQPMMTHDCSVQVSKTRVELLIGVRARLSIATRYS